MFPSWLTAVYACYGHTVLTEFEGTLDLCNAYKFVPINLRLIAHGSDYRHIKFWLAIALVPVSENQGQVDTM